MWSSHFWRQVHLRAKEEEKEATAVGQLRVAGNEGKEACSIDNTSTVRVITPLPMQTFWCDTISVVSWK